MKKISIILLTFLITIVANGQVRRSYKSFMANNYVANASSNLLLPNVDSINVGNYFVRDPSTKTFYLSDTPSLDGWGWRQPVLTINKELDDWGTAIAAFRVARNPTAGADIRTSLYFVRLFSNVEVTRASKGAFVDVMDSITVNSPSHDVHGFETQLAQIGTADSRNWISYKARASINKYAGIASGNMANLYGFYDYGFDIYNGASGRPSNIYAFYSNAQNFSAVSGNSYHFYGKGNYPSYLGGDLNVQGDVVLMPNLPTSAPATSGALWNDAGTLKIVP